MPGLLCGGQASLRGDASDLRRSGVTHILSMVSRSGQSPRVPSWLPKTRHKIIHIDDTEEANMKQYFGDMSDFISDVKSGGGKVYVHSLAGISRAPAAVTAFLMRAGKLTFDHAIGVVRKGRCCARPNSAFVKQLKSWEQDVLGKKAAAAKKSSPSKRLSTQGRRTSAAPSGAMGAPTRIRTSGREAADRTMSRPLQSVARKSVRSPRNDSDRRQSERRESSQRGGKPQSGAPTTAIILTEMNVRAGFVDVVVGTVAVRVPVPPGSNAGGKLLLDMQLLSNHAMDHVLAEAEAVQRAADDMANMVLLDQPDGLVQGMEARPVHSIATQQLPPPLNISGAGHNDTEDNMSDLSDG